MTIPAWIRWSLLALVALNCLLWLANRATPPAVPTAPAPTAGERASASANNPLMLLGEQTRLPGGRSAGHRRCFSIGPLPDPLAQRDAMERLRPFVLEMSARDTEFQSDRGWWVYLPTADRAEAQALGQRLRAAGDSDFYIISEGPLADQVSTGLFRHRDNARNRQAQLRQLGFEAALAVHRVSGVNYWVDYQMEASGRAPWATILRTTPGAINRSMPCPDNEWDRL